ncbi:hypothetical protein L873DRAFT_1812503, partial [Choiromyces venosus 120613-1]
MSTNPSNKPPSFPCAPEVHPLISHPNAHFLTTQSTPTHQVWDLGDQKIYTFYPHESGVYQYSICRLLRQKTTARIPEIYNEWVTGPPGYPVHHVITEKVEGWIDVCMARRRTRIVLDALRSGDREVVGWGVRQVL